MIPRHSLPFGIGTSLAALVAHSPDAQARDVEKAYADALGVHAAVLLPSVRAGIHMTIQAVDSPGMIAVGPAYTCHTVHEALALSGVPVRLVDAAPGSFLMPSDGISAASGPGCALVLSEVYGLPYDRELLPRGPRVRIFDMAMSVSTPERVNRLEAGDVALFSFGWGKPMYAGWGGIACFQDPELAARVRGIRDRWAAPESISLRVRSNCSTLLQVAMNQRSLYGLLHERHLYRMYEKIHAGQNEQECAMQPLPGQAVSALPAQWTRPMTALNRKLALRNLRDAAQNAGIRRRQAEIYSRLLAEPGIVRGPEGETLPQSHFPVLVPSAVRHAMCDYLRGRGIDTGMLFPLPPGLSRESYPHAARAAGEVITLPLGPGMTLEEVRMVAGCVKDGLSHRRHTNHKN